MSELAMGLVLLQLQTPMLLVECDCVPMLGELVELLNRFNQLAPGASKEDEEDMSWPEVKSMCIPHYTL